MAMMASKSHLKGIKLMRPSRLILMAVLSALIATSGVEMNTSVSASAASWHRGTPRILRGHWKSNSNIFYIYRHSMMMYTKSPTGIYVQGTPFYHGRYKRIGRTYKIHFSDRSFKFRYINRNKLIGLYGNYFYRI